MRETATTGTPHEGDTARPGLHIRFCGGCNPAVDRVALANDVADACRHAEATLYLSGCMRACASGHELIRHDGTAVVVAGDCVDGVVTSGQLADSVKRRLLSSRPMSKG